MNEEAPILELIRRVETLEMNTRTGMGILAIGTIVVLRELADLRTEVREDVAAVGDELGGLRWHMNELFAALHREMLCWLSTTRQPGNPARQEPTHN
ncbi:hypothetical protein [Nonomuraea fuscirosea]|uniref:hypothetical protein n=1 Tax=Nonomuraea fuscirosea TaxID=1291556 RepID=UPI003449F939